MASDTQFSCDFCGAKIVKAAKGGARGYCGIVRDGEVVKWSFDPFEKLKGPHICERCIGSLTDSVAFKTTGLHIS